MRGPVLAKVYQRTNLNVLCHRRVKPIWRWKYRDPEIWARSHSKSLEWHHLIDRIRVPIGIPYQL